MKGTLTIGSTRTLSECSTDCASKQAKAAVKSSEMRCAASNCRDLNLLETGTGPLNYTPRMGAETRTLADAVNVLVDDSRARCLWFLRADYCPAMREERLGVLEYVQRYGDRDAHVRVAALRQWLSQSSTADSVAS